MKAIRVKAATVNRLYIESLYTINNLHIVTVSIQSSG